ncbi:MAG: hemolysin family protein [Candidatus Eisenbacteria bacterium]
MSSGNLVLLFAALTVAAALFSATEIALFSVSRARARRFAQEAGPVGEVFRRLLEAPHATLVQILFANNLAIVAATATAAVLMDRAFDRFALPEWALIAVETFGLTAYLLVVCELTPKTLAFEKNETVAPALARLYSLMSPALAPVARGLERIAQAASRLVKRHEPEHLTADELETLVEVGAREGTLNPEESRLFRGAFRFGEMTAGEILTPRADVLMMSADTRIEDALEQVAGGLQPRIPLYDGTIARVVGVLYARDLVRFKLEDPGEKSVRAIMRRPLVVPPTRGLEELLRTFQAERVHLAVVVDDAGEALGIVRLDDVLEQIVGPIEDEFEEEEPAVRPLGEGQAIFRGSVLVSEANRLVGVTLPGVERETLAALCARLFAQAPSEGETLELDGALLTIEAVTGWQVWSVRVARRGAPTPGAPRAAEGAS